MNSWQGRIPIWNGTNAHIQAPKLVAPDMSMLSNAISKLKQAKDSEIELEKKQNFLREQENKRNIFAEKMQNNSQIFQSSENELNRTQQRDLQNNSQIFQSGENSKNRTQQRELQNNSQIFQSGENSKNRTFQRDLQDDSQSFQSGENELNRTQQRDLQDDRQTFQSGENSKNRTFQTTLAEKRFTNAKNLIDYKDTKEKELMQSMNLKSNISLKDLDWMKVEDPKRDEKKVEEYNNKKSEFDKKEQKLVEKLKSFGDPKTRSIQDNFNASKVQLEIDTLRQNARIGGKRIYDSVKYINGKKVKLKADFNLDDYAGVTKAKAMIPKKQQANKENLLKKIRQERDELMLKSPTSTKASTIINNRIKRLSLLEAQINPAPSKEQLETEKMMDKRKDEQIKAATSLYKDLLKDMTTDEAKNKVIDSFGGSVGTYIWGTSK